MKKSLATLFRFSPFLPLSFFSAFAFWHGVPTNERWIAAFELAALIGLIQLTVAFFQPKAINRLVLGGNIYLIVGGVCAFFQYWPIFKLYNLCQESAIIGLMLAVGLGATLFTPSGFIAVESTNKSEVLKASYILLFATSIVLLCTIIFRGKILYSMIIPILCLLLLQNFLIKRLERKNV